jgi:hypothetical protein
MTKSWLKICKRTMLTSECGSGWIFDGQRLHPVVRAANPKHPRPFGTPLISLLSLLFRNAPFDCD